MPSAIFGNSQSCFPWQPILSLPCYRHKTHIHNTHTLSVRERERQRQRMNHVHKDQFSLVCAHSKKPSHCTHRVIRQHLSPLTWPAYNVEGERQAKIQTIHKVLYKDSRWPYCIVSFPWREVQGMNLEKRLFPPPLLEGTKFSSC